MVANRIMGSVWVLIGVLMVVLGVVLALARVLSLDAWLSGLPGGLGDLYSRQDLHLPGGFLIFLPVLGLLLVFYGGAVLGRVSWALLVGVILSAILTLFVAVLAVDLVLWKLNTVPGTRSFLADNAYYIAGALGLLALLIGYATIRMHSDENRNDYALPFAGSQPLTAICPQCGRILTAQGCPVHDRPAINGLLVRTGTDEVFPITQQVVRLGRDQAKNNLVFAQNDISREQAAIVWQDGAFYLTNLGERNPTQVNGQALTIPPGQAQSPPVPLPDGSQIALGSLHFTFYTNAANYAARPQPAQV